MANSNLPTVLEGIVEGRRGHLAEIRARIAHVDTEALEPSTRSLYDSLSQQGRGGNNFIMECKSSSPSLGMIREHYEPGAIARVYSRYAAGISVLCELDRFGGDYDHLATVASSTHLPVLCKDFIIDAVQIHAARYFGADAILLMLSVLDDLEYAALAQVAAEHGLDVLTEVIDKEELERALRLGAHIIGVNHRNLHDLSIDLGRSGRLAALAPEDTVVISESGIRDNETVRQLGRHSNGFLVGSQLTSQPDVDAAARRLVFGPNKVCGLGSASAAQSARAAGATYGGLIFEEGSPRNVSRETAQKIIAHEPDLNYVAVSRRTSGYSELMLEGVTAVQIHSSYQGSVEAELELISAVRAELPEDIDVWRAVSMTTEHGPALAEALIAQGSVDLLVLDAGDGGTGTSFDWSRIPNAVKQQSLLAGGLGPDNLEKALAVGCHGLDLNSGVEYPSSAGQWARRKDAGSLRRAFETIRRYSY
ncbi:bifunctional indole-3-glycerol-phosphate synthase TrpC/phosphoribosylanthranilate isomerase TrpF [Corynebacterium alimapuense]|uniref:N-(5'-phosphoribosyl)anthranilate isomerase n=1 Tax=Corynebacterium alimapuense TaxID=1576874 RepID=A0A3M8K6G1_9CORY|nr:bifunctional indole-3-glycerol-phosphate synthase TrpC/phosphoribosylanthranilate isomerase TrpF [Corynebacterium alimapuense]RNE48108.1 bifunctional indole-3-glycerol-phosphate synthase TrpC/phosphoribosylanthranilate isomerase TrpF [Corynebacterium alimapuense]